MYAIIKPKTKHVAESLKKPRQTFHLHQRYCHKSFSQQKVFTAKLFYLFLCFHKKLKRNSRILLKPKICPFGQNLF